MNDKLDRLYKEFGSQICLFPFLAGFYSTNHVGSTINTIRPCSLITKPKSEPGWKINDSIVETRNNATWKSLRKIFIEKSCHDAPSCLVCSQNEKNGATSARQLNNKFFTEHLSIDINAEVAAIINNEYNSNSILSLDYFPSNYCNYECIMCSGDASSKRNTFEIKFLKQNQKIILNSVNKDFYEILNTVEIINFTGGETLLQPEVFNLIDYLIEKDLAKNITLTMLTNASNFPEQLIDKFKKFKNIFYTISIDGTKDIIEYQRRGSDWITVEQNAKKIYSTFGALINFVLTSVSVFGIIDFLNWARQNKIDKICISPVFVRTYLSMASIPLAIRNPLIEKIKTAKNQLAVEETNFIEWYDQVLSVLENIKYSEMLHREFIVRMKTENIVSKKQLHKVIPEWAPYFE